MDKKAHKRAHEILEAQLKGNLDPKTARGIRAWFIGAVHEEEKFLAMERHWHREITESDVVSESLAADFLEISERLGFPKMEYEKPRLMIPVRKTMVLRRRIAFRVAAVLLPFFLIAGAAYLWFGRVEDVVIQPAVAEVVVMEGGSPEDVELSDGSFVSMIAGTLRHNNRYVELDGEAYFNVAKDSLHAFTVKTDRLSIVVLGTEFKVHSLAAAEVSTIDLYHGSVRVEADGNSLIMFPGQHLDFVHATGEFRISKIHIDDLVYDQMPNLVFDGGSLEDAFAVIEREYGVPVIIEGELPTGQGGLRVDLSGARSIGTVMNILSTSTGLFTYDIGDTLIYVKPRAY